MTTRLAAFAKYYGVGLLLGGFVSARHCFDILSESSLEIQKSLVQIERYGDVLVAMEEEVAEKRYNASKGILPAWGRKKKVAGGNADNAAEHDASSE